MLTKAGGTFTLSAEANFGATYGTKAPYYKTATTNPAAAGTLRLAKTDTVSWRNNANGGDLPLGIDASDNFTFNSTKVPLSGAIVNADIAGGAAIAYSKLALTGAVLNADLAGSIAYSKLALTGAVLNADLAGSIAYSKLVLTNSVVNADIASAAAIAYSKLTLTGAIVNADVSTSAAIAYSKLNLAGSVVNADVASGAAIAYSKLALSGAILNADLAGSIAYSKLALTGAILNADLAGSIAYSKLSLTGAILNADLAGSIADSKLSTISTAGKVSNAATTATDANTASAIVARDSSGNFSAGTITASLTGTASLATNVTTNANLTGPVTSVGNATAIADGALALAKLATTTAGFIPVGAASTGVPTYVAMSGDVTIGNTGVTAIGATKVTNAMLAGSIDLTSKVTGALPLANGGTGQTSANSALNALLPAQGSSAGQVLSTDGTNTSWAAALSSTLSQYNTFVGNASNVGTATNTNLLGDVIAQTRSQTATMTIATPAVVTSNAHGLTIGDKVYFTTSIALPTGLSANTTYYASNITTNTFNLSTTLANAMATTYIATSGSQSGTHTLFMGGLTTNAGFKGSVSGNAVTAGFVGEYKEVNVTSPVSMSSGVYIEVTSALSLPIGVWDVTGNIGWAFGASSTVYQLIAFIGTATGNNSTGQDVNRNTVQLATGPGGTGSVLVNSIISPLPVWRINVTSATSYYLKTWGNFSSTCTAVCNFRATRVA